MFYNPKNTKAMPRMRVNCPDVYSAFAPHPEATVTTTDALKHSNRLSIATKLFTGPAYMLPALQQARPNGALKCDYKEQKSPE